MKKWEKRKATTELQKEWQEVAEKYGNKYVILRSFDEFRNEINDYLEGIKL